MHNLLLSTQRAGAIKNRLAEAGVEGARLSIKGFGAEKPLNPNTSKSAMAANRRVEIILLK